jgi:hypothetical protein
MARALLQSRRPARRVIARPSSVEETVRQGYWRTEWSSLTPPTAKMPATHAGVFER